MLRDIRGELKVWPGERFALVAAEFNGLVTHRLTEAAVDCLRRHGAAEEQIVRIWTPGSFELPTIARRLAGSGRYAAVLCLGCVIRGQTGHYDHVAQQTAQGIAAVGRETGVPTIFAVITADTVEQAMDRAGLKLGNTGWNAACAAMEMASVVRQVDRLARLGRAAKSIRRGALKKRHGGRG